MKRLIFFFSLFYFSALCAGSNQKLQEYHELRSQMLLVCVNALIYFDAEQGSPDPRNLMNYQVGMQRIDTIAKGLEDTDSLQGVLVGIAPTLHELEKTPRDEGEHYAILLTRLLDARIELDSWASKRYQERKAGTPESVLLLHSQSLSMGNLLLGVQAAHARLLGQYSLAGTHETNADADRQIEHGFLQLEAYFPEHADYLQDIHKNYRFVRGALLQDVSRRPLGSVALYLGKSMEALDGLSSRLLQ